jgi:hypothetical protein
MAVWVGVIAALSGALLGGGLALLNARLQFNQQIQRERKKLVLTKLEELHEVLTKVRKSYEASTLDRISDYFNVETPADAKDAMKTPIERVHLLVSFYAPNLNDSLSRLEELRMDYGKVLSNAILYSKSDTASKQKTLGALQVEWKKIDTALGELQTQVVALSRNYL